MQEIVTAGGIVTGGIANEKKYYVTLELDQPQFSNHFISPLSGGGQQARLAFFPQLPAVDYRAA